MLDFSWLITAHRAIHLFHFIFDLTFALVFINFKNRTEEQLLETFFNNHWLY